MHPDIPASPVMTSLEDSQSREGAALPGLLSRVGEVRLERQTCLLLHNVSVHLNFDCSLKNMTAKTDENQRQFQWSISVSQSSRHVPVEGRKIGLLDAASSSLSSENSSAVASRSFDFPEALAAAPPIAPSSCDATATIKKIHNWTCYKLMSSTS